MTQPTDERIRQQSNICFLEKNILVAVWTMKGEDRQHLSFGVGWAEKLRKSRHGKQEVDHRAPKSPASDLGPQQPAQHSPRRFLGRVCPARGLLPRQVFI